MAGRAPGRSERQGVSLVEVIEKFPDDASAEAWFHGCLWPGGPHCPRCGSLNVRSDVKHPSMTHRCRDCPERPMFSLRTGTVMRSSKLGYRTWALAIYLHVTSLKGVSSMKLHRDLGITQKNAWHLGHRLREAWGDRERAAFGGPRGVEVDETYVGGRKKRGVKGRGGVGKAIVAGARERDTGRVHAGTVGSIQKKDMHRFVRENVRPDAPVYTDELASYRGIPNPHETVCHSAGEYVNGMASTNGIESFWAALKRGYHGTFHRMSHRHLDRYVAEFAGRHNVRDMDTVDAMGGLAGGMAGKRLRYGDLTRPKVA